MRRHSVYKLHPYEECNKCKRIPPDGRYVSFSVIYKIPIDATPVEESIYMWDESGWDDSHYFEKKDRLWM